MGESEVAGGFFGLGILDGSLLKSKGYDPTGDPPWECPKCGKKAVTIKKSQAVKKETVYKQYECSECGWRKFWYKPRWERLLGQIDM